MKQRQQRMSPEYARTGIAHNLTHLPALLRPVAVDRTLRTGWLATAIGTQIEALPGVVGKLGTLPAELTITAVMISAEHSQHDCDRHSLAVETVPHTHTE
jgi:hypothetical protein